MTQLSRQQRRFIERKGKRTPSFNPVANQQINGMYQAFRLALLKDGVSAVDSHNEAMNSVRRALPAPRIGVKLGRTKLSRSDNPEYRNKPYILKAFRPHEGVRPVDRAAEMRARKAA